LATFLTTATIRPIDLAKTTFHPVLGGRFG
jgi:hypothetical protein